MPQPSAWSAVPPPRAEKPVNAKVAALGALLFRAKSWHIGGGVVGRAAGTAVQGVSAESRRA